MLLILFTTIIVALITYLSLKPLIDNLFYSVPDEPRYIHSYIPFFGFGLKMMKDPIELVRSLYLKCGKTFAISIASKRWVYLVDEQAYLTKALKSPNLSINEVLIDFVIDGFGVGMQCLSNPEVQQIHLDHYHQYLVGDELEILNERVHGSLIESMKLDAKIIEDGETKFTNLFDHFGEMVLYAATEGLFRHSFAIKQRNISPSFYKLFQDLDKALLLSVLRVPFRSNLYKSTFVNQREFIKRFSSLKVNTGESNVINAREKLYHSDKYKHLFTEYNVGALLASVLWAAVTNTRLMSCWIIIDLLLHPEAIVAVKKELKKIFHPHYPHQSRKRNISKT